MKTVYVICFQLSHLQKVLIGIKEAYIFWCGILYPSLTIMNAAVFQFFQRIDIFAMRVGGVMDA